MKNNSYTYKIGWSEYDTWYYGVRWANKHDPINDLWVHSRGERPKASSETKTKMRESRQTFLKNNPDHFKGSNNGFFGKVQTTKQKTAVSLAMKKRWDNAPYLSCPYCDIKTKSKTAIVRFHGDKCNKRIMKNEQY